MSKSVTGRPLTHRHDRSSDRGHCKVVARRIDLFCIRQVMGAEYPVTAPNGGYARGYQRNPRGVDGPADPRLAQHAAAWPEYLCSAVLDGECASAAFRYIRGVVMVAAPQPDGLPVTVVADACQGHGLMAAGTDLANPSILYV
jgi:hypothetical protein